MASSFRHVIVPSETYAYIFRTFYTYDSFGRVKTITYPDGDDVLYKYHGTGELESVTHHPESDYGDTLVSRLQYNEYGQRIYQSHGSGVESVFMYSPQRQWLTNKATLSLGYALQDLSYSYDSVGNILEIQQQAPDYSGLGGDYVNDYTYDNQYRLVRSTGTSNYGFGYNFSMSYSPSGQLGHNSCVANNVNKKLRYGYDNHLLTHQPRVVYDSIAQTPFQLYWDANGNLDQIQKCKEEKVRFHFWDDENRLHSVIGPNDAGFYGYDGNGDRVWKLTGTCSLDGQNGANIAAEILLDDVVLYPNPYMTITQRDYTKHFYIGQERISTVIGEGGWSNAHTIKELHDIDICEAFEEFGKDLSCETFVYPYKNQDILGYTPEVLQYDCAKECLQKVGLKYASGLLESCILSNEQPSGNKESVYHIHSDHLGSASWITNKYAEPEQYIHYAPYGELLANQQVNTYDERYKFTGKERDAETGYDYFGARFLSTQLGIWTRPDPLVDKYIYASPYMYCNGNPIKFVDPDGNCFDAIWDILWIAYDAASLVYDMVNGNTEEASMDAASMALDAGALLVPGFPTMAGAERAFLRMSTKVDDAAKATKTATTGIKATANNYRHALQKATGKIGKGYEAHHTLPQKHRDKFEKLGLNIDEPGNVVWRKNESHRAGNKQHGKAWDEYFEEHPHASREEVLQERDRIEIEVWHNHGDSPVE